jgi:hypothetical protein
MDLIYDAFLQRQYQEGMALAESSDLLDLAALPPGESAPRRYVARFSCTGLVRAEDGAITEADLFVVGIWFPHDYLLRRPSEGLTFEVLRWLAPANVYHPNISDRAPLVCIGQIGGGTTLVDILFQLHEIITFNKVNMGDGLNAGACAWARLHQAEFPVDRRPLKRRSVDFQLRQVSPADAPVGSPT